jgi:RHS repeat-associated protein
VLNSGQATSIAVHVLLQSFNDRLITETKTVGGGAPETNTYEYNKTQQHIESGTVDGIHTSQTVEYNLQGLLESVSVIKSNSAIRTRTSYEYDSTGTRTSSARFTRDSLGSGLWEIASRTEFLTDSENHTGYSQVLQETTYEGGVATKKVIFTVGHDQISQSTLAREAGTETWSLESDAWFGTDGHGSVRVLYDLAAAIAKDLANAARLQVYTFDAYGNLQGWPTSSLTPNTLPLTTYLYSGESFDFNIGQQYLRARFYDATTGRFNRLDPFAGNSSDPQSFHKYGYVHGDPVQMIDPTGMFGVVGLLIGAGLQSLLPGPGDSIRGALESLVTAYSINLLWDVNWATNWSLADDMFTRLDDSWVLQAMARGAIEPYLEALRGLDISDDVVSPSAAVREPIASAFGAEFRSGHLNRCACPLTVLRIPNRFHAYRCTSSRNHRFANLLRHARPRLESRTTPRTLHFCRKHWKWAR